MNSWSALVTAAFLVRSPLTARARSSRSGSIDRFVAMCSPPHIILHIAAGGCHLFRWGPEPASGRRPARVRGMSPETPSPDFSYRVGFRAAVTHPTAEPIKRVVVVG